MPAGPFETWHRHGQAGKNPPYQVEAGPLEALNINQLQRRETQVWFAGPKKKNISLSFKLWMWRINKMETAGTFLWPAPAALWWKVKGVSSPPEIRGPSRVWQNFRWTMGTLATTNTKHKLLNQSILSPSLDRYEGGRKFCTPQSKMPLFGVSHYTDRTLALPESFVCWCTIHNVFCT